MRSRQTPSMRSTQAAPKPQGAPSSLNVPRTMSAPKKSVVVEAALSTSRRLVSAHAAGGATQVAQLSPGQFIEHERFGVGEVLKVEGTGENTKAHIRFKNAGEKQLLLKFARFRVLS